MVTTVTSTISLSGSPDYSTLQAWEDAAPVDLVTADQIWKGVIQRATDNFTGTDIILTVGGSTTDATHYKELTVAAGASFVDNIGANPLRYDESNGASVSSSSSVWTIDPNEWYFRISRLQIQNTDSTETGGAIDSWIKGVWVDQCIMESRADWATASLSTDGVISNSLVVCRKSGATNIILINSNGALRNVTLAVPSDLTPATNAIRAVSTGQTVQNCAIFGATNIDNTGTPVYTTCITDDSTPPSGCIATTYSTSAGAFFENISDGTHDYRIKSSSVLRDAGTNDATYAANDIVGTPRVSGVYDIGCFEFTISGAAVGSSAATGTLTTEIQLSADAVSQALAAAGLTTQIQLDGAALNAASGAGSLTANIQISGNAAVLVLAGADLTTQIPLSTEAVAQVLASAELSGGVIGIKSGPRYSVVASWRDYDVAA